MKLDVPKASPSASLWRPMGESPVSAGVPDKSGQAVPGSQTSGKLVHREVCSEVSQTAVSVLTNSPEGMPMAELHT